ncbi:hypothetical protein NDU88_010741 [Pleurodeles waltl]|uniref:Uncharacterized protein n=1 Tax=Pleurodeles waltl TaxID=8319 RepID=A0AAV7S4A7_PLEWA|nr:hypothetical protein NDU88_010741 [Pleurodeles waltl]
MRRSVERDLTRVVRALLRPEEEVTNNQTERSRLPAIRAEHLSLLERLRCLNYTAHSARTHASADKAGKLLGWLIRRDCERKPIVEIRSHTGELTYTPVEIQAEFMRHYEALYASRAPPRVLECMTLDNLEPLIERARTDYAKRNHLNLSLWSQTKLSKQ